jgi:hypothetical protein
LLFQRGTQTYLWALPLINTLGMKNGSEKVFGAGYNVLPIWKKRLDAKTLVTTPNSDVIYAMSYVDLGTEGPLVFEAPPGLQGILLDFWQRPIPVDGGKFFGDVGLPGPDAGARKILDDAAKTSYKMSRVIGVEGGRSYLVYPDRHWVNPLADATPSNPGADFKDMAWTRRAGYLDLDARIWFFTDYYSFSPGMTSQTPGKGAKYMIAFADSTGTLFLGEGNYRVNLPPNIPAANFWSLTLYEAENASGLANGQPFPSLGLRDNPVKNADGSVDLYLGPTAPPGKEANWLATVPGRGYFSILWLYGPTEAAIDKSWKPSDIEPVK